MSGAYMGELSGQYTGEFLKMSLTGMLGATIVARYRNTKTRRKDDTIENKDNILAKLHAQQVAGVGQKRLG